MWVIGPEEDLYCASHIRGIFHHSSFFGDGAVLAGGEIKTDGSGKIIGLTAKSGHYKPSSDQNCTMLKWFKDRGCDLSEINDFRYFDEEGKEQGPVNAQNYLNTGGQYLLLPQLPNRFLRGGLPSSPSTVSPPPPSSLES